MNKRLISFLAPLCAVLGAIAPVRAGTEIVVMADQAKMLAVTGEAGTVVVGNPNIADVTVRGRQIFVHGRNYGSTNVIVLDRDGNQIALFDVTVMLGGIHNINVFRAASKFSYACAPTCESTLQVGDNIDYFKGLQEANKLKGDSATGATSAKN